MIKQQIFLLWIAMLITFFCEAQTTSVFKANKKYGLKNSSTGAIIIPAMYKEVFPFTDGLALAKLDKKYGFIDAKNKMIIAPTFDYVLAFSEGVASAKKNKLWGYINTKGETFIPFTYQFAYSFSEGLAGVKKGNLYFFINKENKIVLGPYQEVASFKEGYAAFKQNGLWGYINKAGKVMIAPAFTMAFPFNKGVASVVKNGVKMDIKK